MQENPAPKLAVASDDQPLWTLRRQLEDWIFAKGLTQWRPGEVPLTRIQEQIAAGEWHVYRDGQAVAAALRVLLSDPGFWGDDDGQGVYVHGLMVDRGHAGQGLGGQLLDWAGRHGHVHGKAYLRLDSAADNPELCRYYAARGFTAVGEKKLTGGLNDVVLWQRPTRHDTTVRAKRTVSPPSLM